MMASGTGFPILDGQTVIFIGDSITDCDRRGGAAPLGTGYVRQIVDLVTAAYPERIIAFHNKGIGGDTSGGLVDRWGDDVIALSPDWVSVLIGINDLHIHLNGQDDGISPKQYRKNYQAFLDRTADETQARVVLMDPFYMSEETVAGGHRTEVLELLSDYIQVVRDMADQFDTLHVPLQDLFRRQLQFRPSDMFGAEPVHPQQLGHAVIAQSWLSAVGW